MKHVEIIEQIYAAFARGDVPTILGYLSPDIEWEYESVDHGVPWLKPGRGRDHVAGFFGSLQGIDLNQFELVSMLEGRATVAAVFRVGITVKATGLRIHDLEVHLWDFAPDGHVSRFRHVVDTRQHVAAIAGQSATAA